NLVIGVEEDYFFNKVDSEIERLVRDGIKKLEEQDAKVKKVKIQVLKYSEWAELITSLSEASSIHQSNMLTRPYDVGHDIRMLFELAELRSAVNYRQAQQVRRQLKQEFNKALQEVDIIAMPTLPILPNDIGDDWADLNGEKVDLIDNIIRFMEPGNLTSLPALSVPFGFSKDLIVGMQLMRH